MFFQAIEEGAEIPPEAVRLLKKAMKQRRGSVDNVAASLMDTLAASGESQESVARAMVKVCRQGITNPNTRLLKDFWETWMSLSLSSINYPIQGTESIWSHARRDREDDGGVHGKVGSIQRGDRQGVGKGGLFNNKLIISSMVLQYLDVTAIQQQIN